MHVPGVLNKVVDCLSRYYENDRFDEIHESHHYVSADLRLDPQHEDLTELRLKEIAEEKRPKQLLARRIRNRDEDRVIEAGQMASASQNIQEGHPDQDVSSDEDITVGEALQSGPPLREIVYQDDSFIKAVKDGYKLDSVFSKIIDNPGHYPTFRLIEGILHTKNRLGDECMCVPRSLLEGKRSLPEIVIDHAHNTLGHLGPQKTSEYARRWFWWPRMGKDIEKFCLTCGSCQMSKTSNKHPLGLLHSLPIPTRPWESVGPFPESDGFDYLWVIICRLTNLCHLTPISVQTTTVDLAWYYI